MSLLKDTPNYYMPYESDDGTDSGTDNTDDDPDEESDLEDADPSAIPRPSEMMMRGIDPRIGGPNGIYDPRYAIHAAAGPSITTEKTQIYLREHESFSLWNPSTNITSLKGYKYAEPTKTTKTSLISIKSSNRDLQVYPSPYNFQIKLPRVYRKVVKFQFVQISFPKANGTVNTEGLVTSSLCTIMINDGVPVECISTCLQVINCTTAVNSVALMEQGRNNSSGSPLLVTLSVPDGNYTNTQLAQELTFRANSTPPLNIISYSTFRDIFMNTRDGSILFNEPGDYFYSNATGQKYGAHTKENIMNTYYNQQHIDGLITITDIAAHTAYYFPILKELIATNRAAPFLQTDGMEYSEVANRVLGPFEGLTSPFYSTLCQINQDALDIYRPNLTFELRNINKYSISYASQQKRFSILHDSLHPSLSRELHKMYHSMLNQELTDPYGPP
jgi:hypothetical protein